jgi:hypothetical protein
MSKHITITVRELRERLLKPLAAADDDTLVLFGQGDLSLYRVKDRGPVGGPALLQVEFNEPYTVDTRSD